MLGKRRKEEKNLGSAFDRLLNYTLRKNEDINIQLMELADIIMANRPVLINFEEISSIGEVNYVVSFLSGVVYALSGTVYRFGDETRLFASGRAFEDGTLKKYIKDFGINN